MRTAIVNLGRIVTGDLTECFAAGDGILMEDGRIVAVGIPPADQVADCDVAAQGIWLAKAGFGVGGGAAVR